MSLPMLIFVVVVVNIFLISSLRVVSEYQRLAIFRLGRYFGLKGPGLLLLVPHVDRGFKIAVGDQGVLLGDGVGKFKTVELPVQYHEKIAAGSRIKISGFVDEKIQVAFDANQARTVRCEKCGHEMMV